MSLQNVNRKINRSAVMCVNLTFLISRYHFVIFLRAVTIVRL